MKKYIIIVLAAIVATTSCTHEIITKGKPSHVYPVYKNSYRAKAITGTNEVWGDFKFHLNYKNDRLVMSYRTDNLKDTVGAISVSSSSTSNIYAYIVTDYVINISEDSIKRLDKVLESKYGVGNYSLKDTIYNKARAGRVRLRVNNNEYSDGRIQKSEFIYFKPQEFISPVDENFTTEYEQVRKVVNNYEYNDDGRIIANRWYEDIYKDPKDLTIYDRTIYKYEIAYDKDKVLNLRLLKLIAGDSFVEQDDFVYNYSGGKLMSVKGNNTTKNMVYNGNYISEITEGGMKYTYSFDGNGYVTKIDDNKGNVMNIEYESGHGNFSDLMPLFEIVSGKPYIK